MADELQISAVVQLINGYLRESFVAEGLRITQNDLGAHGPVIVVSSSEEVIDFGDIVTPGYCFFRNLDEETGVTIGPESGGSMIAMIYLEPNDIAMMRLDPSVVLRAQSDGYDVKLQMLLLED